MDSKPRQTVSAWVKDSTKSLFCGFSDEQLTGIIITPFAQPALARLLGRICQGRPFCQVFTLIPVSIFRQSLPVCRSVIHLPISYVCHTAHVEFRGQLVGICSLLPTRGSAGSNLGHQAWQEVTFPAESCQPSLAWFFVLFFGMCMWVCLFV